MDYAGIFRLDGLRAVVIGGGSGIGRESAIALAAFGAEVVCADLDLDAAAGTADLIGSGASVHAVDTTNSDDMHAMARELGHVDVLVTSVGVNVRKRIVDYTQEDLMRVIQTNLIGTFNVLQAFGPAMAEAGSGSIISFSSIRATVVEPGQGAYAASKAGAIQLMRAAAAEYGPRGVRCNSIAPGVVETALTEPIRSDPEWENAYATKSALKRWAKPSELVGAVVYLASSASSYVTGAVLHVDGGWTAIDGRYEPPA